MLLRLSCLLSATSILMADEADRGAPNILMGIFGIALLIFGPLVGGVILAFIQFGIYRLLVKTGLVAVDGIPMFPVLLLRGMMVLIACVAIGLLMLKVSGRSLPLPDLR